MQVDLVERASRGDRDAFATLAESAVDRCYGLAYRILRDHHRAQDATQQALLGAWRDLPKLRDPARFDAWLYRLVVHACYIDGRSHRRWTAKVRLVAPGDEAADDPAIAIAQRDQLERSFSGLSPEQRAVVVLRHHLGYPMHEIASLLGIPEGTVKSRLHYAVRQIRGSLDRADRLALASKEHSA